MPIIRFRKRHFADIDGRRPCMCCRTAGRSPSPCNEIAAAIILSRHDPCLGEGRLGSFQLFLYPADDRLGNGVQAEIDRAAVS